MAVQIAEFDTHTRTYDPSVNATAVKDVFGGPCKLTHIWAENTNTASEDVWLELYDDTNPTPGTTAPFERYKLPHGGGSAKEAAFPINPPDGLTFNNGISYAITKTKGSAANPTLACKVALILAPL